MDDKPKRAQLWATLAELKSSERGHGAGASQATLPQFDDELMTQQILNDTIQYRLTKPVSFDIETHSPTGRMTTDDWAERMGRLFPTQGGTFTMTNQSSAHQELQRKMLELDFAGIELRVIGSDLSDHEAKQMLYTLESVQSHFQQANSSMRGTAKALKMFEVYDFGDHLAHLDLMPEFKFKSAKKLPIQHGPQKRGKKGKVRQW
jgi:hypothetical protein